MLDRPPVEREAVSWALAAGWTVVIYVTIPFAGDVARAVSRQFGGGIALTVILAMLVALLLACVLFLLIRRGRTSAASYMWFATIACTLLLLMTWFRSPYPAETLHYLQYGVLSMLLYRALSHRIRDCTIYPAAVFLGTAAGTLDEVIQWLTPGRYFDLDDVVLNFTGVVLVQLLLGLAVRPAIISGRPDGRSLGRLCLIAAFSVLPLALCHAVTPERVERLRANLPMLAGLISTSKVMVEYGYLHETGTGERFRSRLTGRELGETDAGYAEEAGKILKAFAGYEKHKAFLAAYPALQAPFLREAGKHLYRRDLNLRYARNSGETSKGRERYRDALGENRILDSYFGQTVRAAGVQWSDALEAEVKQKAGPATPFESRVGDHLTVHYREDQIGWFFLGLISFLLALGVFLKMRAGRYTNPT